MTISSTTRIAGPYLGTGLQSAFSFSFKVFQASDVLVTLTDTSGNITTQTLTSQYSVTLNANQNTTPGGTVTMVTPPPSGYSLAIGSQVAALQPADLTNAGNFYPQVVNDALDRLTILLQQFSAGRSISVPEITGLPLLPSAALRANLLLSFNSNGDPIAVAPASGSSAALALLLASALAGQGASQVGSNDAANYFNGATVEAILQEIGTTKGQFQLDGVNVLRYITPALWPAILNGTSVVDLATQLQTALTAESSLIFPDGLYNTSAKLIPRTDAVIRAINRGKVKLKGTTPITILEFPISNQNCRVENIFFVGSGCTGIATANTGGSNHDYLISPTIVGCDFAWELAYGINSDLIYARIEKSTFGYYGTVGGKPAAGASTMVGLRSFSVSANFANLNRVNDCWFNCGSTTAPGIDLSGGTGWVFTDCDFSFGGWAMRTSNVQMLKFRGTCWVEGANSTTCLFQFGASSTPVDVDGLNVSNNTCTDVFRVTTGATAGLNVRNCSLSLNSPTYPLFDTTALTNTLPADGSVAWYGNAVSGGNAANKIVTGTEFRGGKSSPRLTMAGITTTPGTISSSSDPGAVISYNGVGDVSITASHPFASSTAKVLPILTPQVGFQARVLVISTTQVRVQVQTAAGAAVDGAFGLVVYGS